MAREFVQQPETFEKAEDLKRVLTKEQLQDVAWALNKQYITEVPDTDEHNKRITNLLRVFDTAAGTNYSQRHDHRYEDSIEYDNKRKPNGSLKK